MEQLDSVRMVSILCVTSSYEVEIVRARDCLEIAVSMF